MADSDGAACPGQHEGWSVTTYLDMLDCGDFPDAPPCCGHCHDDEERGYGGLAEHQFPDGRVAQVCCVVNAWIAKRALAGTKEGG